ncbi:adenylate/guanylate cyclase domain-containing protein [Streptomyces boncukensis]|uniref:Adenylate/guanylate cyclase domain-containing protein n=1 Tax=Streptomyces boncukensis TaxID=2711219 RepID=A0A6G4X7A5_9ACTN|nr:adenylate/guanylate cyclase domain-containing protein [Streptomyces boncukensis]NGO72551.1 adenylate/guanylate cyclase domain-containing protein [Streptomyces boncukensis]
MPRRTDGNETGDGDARERIENVLLGGGRAYTRAAIVEKSGIPAERTNQIWRALGFPLAGEEEAVFTEGDLQALRAGEFFVESGVISAESETLMARALGHHLSRLAEWQVDTLWDWLSRQPGLDPAGEDFTELVEQLLPHFERLQNHVWRRHLAACAGRALAAGEEEPAARVQAVGFSDIVGYTRLSRGLDGTGLSRVLDRFEGTAGDTVADHGGRIVKTIGDEVLFTAESAADAAEIALTLAGAARGDAAAPGLRLRTGLAFGPVLSRFGDVYGPVVNTAARLTSLARAGTVLADQRLAGCLAGDPAYATRTLRAVSVRGYSRLRPVLLRRR